MTEATDDAKDLVRDAIDKGVARAASNTWTATQASDVPIITQSVLNEVAPIIVNATNQEPWYQSRVTWGAIASIALPILGALGVSADIIDSDQLVAFGMAAGTVAGGVLTLYGRWKAKKPIGS